MTSPGTSIIEQNKATDFRALLIQETCGDPYLGRLSLVVIQKAMGRKLTRGELACLLYELMGIVTAWGKLMEDEPGDLIQSPKESLGWETLMFIRTFCPRYPNDGWEHEF